MASTISFRDVCYSVPVSSCNPFAKKKKKQILHNISGVFKPGMNAILGPTGSGKTTLLDILAGRIDNRGLEGMVLVDGKEQPKNFNVISGYVVQDDLVMGTLTVEENVQFSANLRLPKTISQSEKNKKVKEVLEELGLEKCSKSKIGTDFIRGVSGGERKRASIAMELITSPLVLFLDEPTTGLDAATATSVLTTLKRLSDKGRTVIFSIHQPRYAIFRLFDNLMLLSEGRTIYHGRADQALDFFNSIGYQCEEHNNPPDFFLDVIINDEQISREQSGADAPKAISNEVNKIDEEANQMTNHDQLANHKSEINHDQKINSHEASVNAHSNKSYTGIHMPSNNPDLRHRIHDHYKSSTYNLELESELESISQGEGNRQWIIERDYNTNFFKQLSILCVRTIKNSIRSPATILLQVVTTILTALIVGLLYYQIGNEAVKASTQNRIGAIFFVIVNQMFSTLSSLELFIKDKTHFIHESASGYYRVLAYFIAKVLCDIIPLRVIPVTIFCVISYFMMGFQMSVGRFFIFYLTVFLTNLTSTCLTILLSSMIKVFAVANLLIGLVYVLMMLFGGFLVNLDSIVVWLRWLQYLSFVKYGISALGINEFKDLVLYSNGTAISGAGEKILDDLGIEYASSWSLWQNQVALLVFSAILLILAYVQLRRIPKHK